MKRFLTLWLLLAQALPVLAGSDGRLEFTFDGWDGPAFPVMVSRPAALQPGDPVVFVMHGMSRNGADYRDHWHELAVRNRFLLVVPLFSKEDFPGSRSYNLGNLYTPEGGLRDRKSWTFSAIEPLFDEVRERFGMQAGRYRIYGHSAGSQFVHRFLMHVPDARVAAAVLANAGWYTEPDDDIPFPYGLAGSEVSVDALVRLLGLPVTVLLGEDDTDPLDDSLRRTPEAMAQGPHRLARGHHFIEAAQRAADRLGVVLSWQLVTVPQAGHDNRLMAPAAVPFLLGENNP